MKIFLIIKANLAKILHNPYRVVMKKIMFKKIILQIKISKIIIIVMNKIKKMMKILISIIMIIDLIKHKNRKYIIKMKKIIPHYLVR